jgi:purine catabolism regulator
MALSIVQMKRKAVMEAEERLRGDLYSDLLSGTVSSEEYVAVRADKLDIPLHGIHCVLEVVPEEGFGHRSADARAHFCERLRGVAVRACGIGTKFAVLPQTEGYLIIFHFPPKTKPDSQEKQIRDIYTAISEQLTGGSADLCVGAGEALDSLLGLMQSCRQAQRAIAMGRKTTGRGGLFFYGQMGIYSLLDVKSIDELHANCISELGRVENAFGGSEEVYLETLEAYFACSESPTEMAKALGVHVNTIKYRLRRIREALGDNFFQNGNEKMRVYLLLKMKKLIQ